MKTIAITIDKPTLLRIDRLVTKSSVFRKGRSEVIRQAVREFVARLDRLAKEEQERKILQRHRTRLKR
jgi:metal-responsive CopG/Arc/MetJ family transcriptional regulator